MFIIKCKNCRYSLELRIKDIKQLKMSSDIYVKKSITTGSTINSNYDTKSEHSLKA